MCKASALTLALSGSDCSLISAALFEPMPWAGDQGRYSVWGLFGFLFLETHLVMFQGHSWLSGDYVVPGIQPPVYRACLWTDILVFLWKKFLIFF